jgi:predicted porin
MYWNDGNNTEGSDTYIVDNTFSGGTFFDLSGSARINPTLSAGFQLTVAICSGSRSNQVTQLNDDVTKPGPGSTLDSGDATGCYDGRGDATLVLTRANWYIDHKSLGRLTVGRQDTATAGLTTIDLGGAGVTANSSIGYWNAGFFLVNDNSGALLTATWNTVLGGSAVSGASLSRGNFIKYTSPTLGGFSVQAAWGEDDVWDVALRYAGEFGGFRIAAGIGYADNQTGANEATKDHTACTTAAALAAGTEGLACQPNQWKGSASILHVASGLFLTGAYVRQENNVLVKTLDNTVIDRPDTELWYVQAGIAKNWTGLGNTVLYAEYARVDDGATGLLAPRVGGIDNFVFISDSRAEMWGLGIVQHIDAAAMEVFLSYRRYSADVTGCDTFGAGPACGPLNGVAPISDIDIVMGGARIRF